MKRSGALLSVALLCVACSAPRVDRAGSAQGEAPEISYRLTLETTPKLGVRFETTTLGSSDGTTEFALDEAWGGATQGGSEFVVPEAFDELGTALQVERPSPHRFIVRHAPGLRVTLRYTLPETAPKTAFVQGGHYRPVLTKSLFHIIGDLAFVAPKHLDSGTPRVEELTFQGFDGWNGASSFAAGFPSIRVRESLGAFRHCVVIAGDVDVESTTVGGKPVTVVTQNGAFAFEHREFAEHALRIVELQRAFFDDPDQPHTLVSAICIGSRDANGFSLGGTGLTHGFALFLPADADFRSEHDEAHQIDWLLAHEMSHHWIGGLVGLKQPEALHYWFSEGFADFVARRVLDRAGLASREQTLQDLNDTLADYAANPQKNAPATRIAADFWNDPDVGDLPYQRGDLVAIAVDHAIRKSSAGKQSLDDLLRELVDDARAKPLAVDTNDLLLRISAWAGADVANRMRRVVVDGETIVLESDTYAPELRLVDGDVPRFERVGAEAVP